MADIATLGLAADSSQLVTAKKNLQDIVPAAKQAEAATTSFGRATEAAGQRVAAANARVMSSAERLARQIDAQAKVIERYNRAARADDIAAYGRQLDQLRAKFNPVFATIERYRDALGEIRQAHAVGAISSSEMAAAISRERTAALASIAALKQRTTETNNLANAQSRVGRQFNTANLAAQGQDIVVTAAMGMNAFQIGLQQGTQAALVFSQSARTAGEATRLLRDAFFSVISPVSLVTIALVTAGAALIQYFMNWKTETADVDAAITTHLDNVQKLQDVYSGASTAVEEYGTRSVLALEAAASRSKEILEGIRKNALEAFSSETQRLDITGLSFLGLGDTGPGTESIADRFTPFADAIQNLRREIAAGNPDFTAFREQIEAIANEAPSWWSGINAADLRSAANELNSLIDPAEQAQTAIERAQDQIEELNKLQLDVARNVSQLNKIEEAAKSAQGAAGALLKMLQGLDTFGEGQDAKGPRIGKRTLDDAQKDFDEALKLERRIGEAFKELDPDKPKKVREEVDKLERSYARTIQTAKERNAQLEVELQYLGDFSVEAEAAVYAQQLMNQAMIDGRTLTPEQTAEINRLAQAYAELRQKLSEAKVMQDLMFEREQLGRTPQEQEVAAALRQLYGRDYKQYMDGAVADTMRLNQQFEEQQDKVIALSDTIREGLGGALYEAFTGGIRSAEDFFDFVTKAFAQLAQQNFDSFVEKLFGKQGTPLGGLGSLFGGGGGRSAPATRGEWTTFAKVIGYEVGSAVVKTGIGAGPDWERKGRGGAVDVGKGMADGIVPQMKSTWDDQFKIFKQAISTVESGSAAGDYGAIGPIVKSGMYAGQRAYGRYQVMEGNIAAWTKEAIGVSLSTQQFLKSAAAQDAVFKNQFITNMKKHGNLLDAASVWFSGGPRSAVLGKGRNDGYNTVESYLSKFSNATQSLPQAVELGALEGTEAGAAAGIVSAVEPGTAQATSPQQAQNGLGQNLMAGLSAGLGGFSTGYQSANPLMGALGGAMQGFGAGGIWGAVIGGFAGLLGGLLGAQNKVKQAQRQLDKQRAQIELLLAVGEGRGVGPVQKRISDYTSETDKAVPLAWAAEDMALVERLHQSVNQLIVREFTDFYNALPGLIEGYTTGFGRQGPKQQGAEAVFDLREDLRAMIADVRYFGEFWINSTLDPTNKATWLAGRGQAAWETELAAARANAEKTMADAYEAARQMALSFISGPAELTEIEEAIASLNGAAETLVPTLVELGMTAEDAARAISGEVVKAMAKLTEEFERSLDSDINAATGRGVFSDMRDLFEEYEKVQKDAKLLGTDPAKVQAWLKAMAQSLVDGSQVIGSTFQELIAAFPELAGVVHEFVGELEDAATRLRGYEDRLFAATNDTSTLAGALAQFDREAAREREREIAAGGENIVMLERVLAAERLRIINDFGERAVARMQQYQNRAFAANNDTSTLAGELAAFDRAAQQERIDEIKQGGEAIKDLDRALAAERAKIIRDHNQRIIDEQKRQLEDAESFLEGWFRSIKEFIDDLKAGSESPLSPAARLAEAQSQFDEQYAKALTGDRDAANSLINYAQNLLDAGRDRFASSEAFQAIWNNVIDKLEQIPDQVSAEQFIVDELTEAIQDGANTVTTNANLVGEMLAMSFSKGPQDTAAALALYFEQLDTSVNGLLTFDEFKSSMEGVATDAQLQAIFNEVDINGDANISKLEALLSAEGLTRTALQNALTEGPASVAGIMATHFNKLDTSVNGLLDKNELKAAIGNLATDEQIAQMMVTLDTNGDGQLSQLELIKAASQGTQTNLDANTGVIRQLIDLRAITQEKFTGMNTLLIRMLAALNSSNALAGGPGSFMYGGYTGNIATTSIAGYVHGQEYVSTSPTVNRLGVRFFDELEDGNVPAVPVPVEGNRDTLVRELLEAVADMTGELVAIKQAVNVNTSVTSQGNERIGAATEDTAREVRTNKVNERMSITRPRTAGAFSNR